PHEHVSVHERGDVAEHRPHGHGGVVGDHRLEERPRLLVGLRYGRHRRTSGRRHSIPPSPPRSCIGRTSIIPSLTLASYTDCGRVAGPRTTRPSASQNVLPCSGHVTVGCETCARTTPRCSGPPMWVHRLSRAKIRSEVRYRNSWRSPTS